MSEDIKKIGIIVSLFVAIIVGVVLLQSSAQNVGDAVNTVTIANQSLTSNIVNGTPQYLTNIKSISNVVVYNETGGIVGAGNYTITNNVIYNGQEAVSIVGDTTAAYKSKWKISGTAQPLGYIADSGGRSVASLVVILAALAIVAVVLYPSIKEFGVFD